MLEQGCIYRIFFGGKYSGGTFLDLIFLSSHVKERKEEVEMVIGKWESKDEVEWRLGEVEENIRKRRRKERMELVDFWWREVEELQPSRSLQETTQPFTYLRIFISQ